MTPDTTPTTAPELTPVPVPSSTAPAEPLETPTIAAGSLPDSRGSVHVSPGPDGALYVLVDSARVQAGEPPSRTVVTLLDRTGAARPGWPIVLEGWTCTLPMTPVSQPLPLVAADGSIRLVCHGDPGDPDTALAHQRVGLAFTSDGRLLPGWPVDLRAGDWSMQAAVNGDTLFTSTWLISGEPGTESSSMSFWVTETTADGRTREGARIPTAKGQMPFDVLGPDGRLRLIAQGEAPTVMAIDVDGPVAGWPIALAPVLSTPAFGPGGRTYFAEVAGGRTRTVVLGPDGAVLPIGSGGLAMEQESEWDGAGPSSYPAGPIVAPDGTVYLLGEDGRQVTVAGLDPGGSAMPGFPVTIKGAIEREGRCGAQDTGCGEWRVRPAVGPDNVLYLPLEATDASSAGSITAIAPDGTVVPGWPVTLPTEGSAFQSVATGADGTVYALVVDRVEVPTSATVLAIDPGGAIRYRVPVVAP